MTTNNLLLKWVLTNNHYWCCNCWLNTHHLDVCWKSKQMLVNVSFPIINLNKSNKRHVSLTCIHRTQKTTKEPIEKKTKKIISVINRQLKAPKTSNYYIPVVVINEMCSNEHEQKQVHNKNFFVFFFTILVFLFYSVWAGPSTY